MAVSTLGKLEPVPVIETARRLCDRIGARFPDRGIHRVAQELVALTEQLLPSAALTLRLPPIRRFVIAFDELIRQGLVGSPTSA